jgi:hypothetical protein
MHNILDHSEIPNLSNMLHYASDLEDAIENINDLHYIDFPLDSVGDLTKYSGPIYFEGAKYSPPEEISSILNLFLQEHSEEAKIYGKSIITMVNNVIDIAKQHKVECFSLNLNYKKNSHIFWHSDFYAGNSKTPEYHQYYLLIALRGPGTLFCDLPVEEVINFNEDHLSAKAESLKSICQNNPQIVYQTSNHTAAIFNVGDNLAPIHSAPESDERFFLMFNLRKLRS